MSYSLFNSKFLNSPQLIFTEPCNQDVEQDEQIAENRSKLIEKIKANFEKNDEKLQQKSLLHTLSLDKFKGLLELFNKEEIDPLKTLANINLAFALEDTDYDGYPDDHIIKIYLHLFELIQAGGGLFAKQIPAQVKSAFESVKASIEEGKAFLDQSEITPWATSVAEKVASLKENESYTMQGGWTEESDGHTMIYRFERKANQTFDLYIYHGNRSAIKSQKSIKTKECQRAHPYLLFKGVTWEELFFCHPGEKERPLLFSNLLYFLTYNSESDDRSVETILNCLGHLGHRLTDSDKLPSLYISIQKSGNCPVKSANCLLLERIGKQEEYKRVSLEIRFLIHIFLFLAFKHKSFVYKLKRTHLFQLREATKNFLRQLDLNFQRKHLNIGEQEYIQALATGRQILTELAEMEKQLDEEEMLPALNPCYHKENEEKNCQLRNQGLVNVCNRNQQNVSMDSKPASLIQLPLDLGLQSTWNTLVEDLNTLSTSILLLKGKNKQELIVLADHAFLNFSHLKTLAPSGMQKEMASRCLDTLLTIQKDYNDAILNLNEINSPIVQHTNLEILALAYLLAVAADEDYGILKDYTVYGDYFSQIARRSPLFTIQNKDALHQRQRLEAFFSKPTMPNKVLFNFVDNIFSKQAFTEGRNAEGSLFRRYILHPTKSVKEELASIAKKCHGRLENDSTAHWFGAFYAFLNNQKEYYPASLSHIALLQNAAFNACLACNIGKPGQYNAYLPRLYISSDYFEGPIECLTSSLGWKSCKDGLNPYFYHLGTTEFCPKSELTFYLEQPSAIRNSEELSENALLQYSQTKNPDPHLPFYLSLRVPDIQTHCILNAIEGHLDLLAEEKYQLFFTYLFTKPAYRNHEIFSPLIEFLQEPLHIARIERIIVAAQKSFVESMPEGQARLSEMLCIIRLYARALQIVRSLYPDYFYPSDTLALIQELSQFLEKTAEQSALTDERKLEILLVKTGLRLGISPHQISIEDQVDLFFSFLEMQNRLTNKSNCGDPSFLRECKSAFLKFSKQWLNYLKESGSIDAFANAVLAHMLDTKMSLKWTLEGNLIISEDEDKWTIYLPTCKIHNRKGPATISTAPLEFPSFIKRLFKENYYHFSSFGNETRFHDPRWGAIRILKIVYAPHVPLPPVEGGAMPQLSISFQWQTEDFVVQRQIQNQWYTYIPADKSLIYDLKLNKALIFDHAIWCHADRPQEAIICDLATGQKLYEFRNGEVYNDAAGLSFHLISDPKKQTIFKGFDSPHFINGWIDAASKSQAEANHLVKFSRFVSAYGAPLSFKWDVEHQAWIYLEDRQFLIDPHAEKLDNFDVSRSLFLINKERTKRKILIPKGTVHSKGFSSRAIIKILSRSQDGHKKVHSFFEYPIGLNHQPIALSMEAKIYLIQLYLAQKQYQETLALIKTISSNEKLSEQAVHLFSYLLRSSSNMKDSSPNACAIRLHAYHKVKTINFIKKSLEIDEINVMTEIYKIYLAGLNNVEHALLLDKEMELNIIEFLNFSTQVSSTRQAFLEMGITDHELIIPKLDKSEIFKNNAPISIPLPFSIFSETNNPDTIAQEANELLNVFIESPESVKDYECIRNSNSTSDPEVQAIFYQLLTSYERTRIVPEQKLLFILFMAAHLKLYAPKLPSKDAEPSQKIEWYTKLKESYLKMASRIKTEGFSSILTFPPFKIEYQNKTNGTALKTPQAIEPAKRHFLPEPKLHMRQDEAFRQWQQRFLKPLSSPLTQAESQMTPISLPSPADFKQRHAARYQRDCQIAHNQAKSKLIFREDVDPYQLMFEMEDEYERCVNNQKNLEAFIKKTANQQPAEFSSFIRQEIVKLGRFERELTLETILRASVQRENLSALKRLNPHLPDSEAEFLHAACIEFMMESTHRDHLKRVLAPLKQWIEEGRTNSSHLDTALEALGETRSYNPANRPVPLFFEFLSGHRVKRKQAAIINTVLASVLESEDPNLQGTAFQLIMAGGKTSTILSMLMELVSEAGLVSCVLCHPSQLASAKGNLTAFQSKRFNKDVYAFDYTVQDLSNQDTLEFMLRRLKEAHKKRVSIIMKSSLASFIELKLILELSQRSNLVDKSAIQNQDQYIKTLSLIYDFLQEHAVSFYDECDINLSILTTVNLPAGQQKSISSNRANLVKAIFSILLNPALKDLVGLDKNLQSELSSQDYDQIVVPFIANQIFGYSHLRLASCPDFKEAFMRYVSGKISYRDQILADDLQKDPRSHELSQERMENVLFLRHITKLSKSTDRYEKEAAHLIALTRQMLTKILRMAFSYSYNRKFGRNPAVDNGQVIPFHAVGTPSLTRFGNKYLALVLHCMSALNNGISKGMITFLAEKMAKVANQYAEKEKKAFNEILEAEQFFDLTSISLHDVVVPDQLEKAWKYINDPAHLERRLAIEVEIAPFHVRYYTKRLSSSPINNVRQFKKSVAFAGVLWNHPTYYWKFKQPVLDEGTEGAILNLLEERAKENPNCIHELKFVNAEHLIQLIENHPNKENIRAIVDGGGYLTEETTAEFAQKLSRSFIEKNMDIDAIIYLHRFSQEEIKSGYPEEGFVLLKPNSPQLYLLENTTKEEIEKYGVSTEKLFAIFDEARVTGTDIKLAAKGIFLNTVDHKMPMRTALQAAFRGRDIFKDQRIEYVVSSKGRKEMHNGGKTFEDLRKTWENNEAVALKEQLDLARPSQMNDVTRSVALKEARQNPAAFKKYEDLLIINEEDLPFAQYGRIKGEGPSLKSLKYYAQHLLGRLKTKAPSGYGMIENEMQTLLNKFEKEIPPDEEMELSFAQDLEVNLELVNEEEIELTADYHIEVNSDIQLELNSYCYSVPGEPYIEKAWELNLNRPLWDQLRQSVAAVPTILSAPYQRNISTKQYASCFPKSLFLTQNLYVTFKQQIIPIFHHASKKAEFILAIEPATEEGPFILLSKKDAAIFKKWLQLHQPEGVFLIDFKGYSEKGKKAFEEMPEPFLKKLWYANLFNGNIDFIEDHPRLSQQLIAKNKDLITRFLQLRLARDQSQLNKLFFSNLFDLQKTLLAANSTEMVVFSYRRIQMEKKYKDFERLGPDQIAAILPEDVENIGSDQVRWLKTAQQVSYLPDDLINELQPEQLNLLALPRFTLLTDKKLIQSIHSPEQIGNLSIHQLSLLSLSQLQYVADAKLEFLSPELVHAIRDSEQIKRFKGASVRLLSQSQVNAIHQDDVQHLADNQIPWLSEPSLIKAVSSAKAPLLIEAQRMHIHKIEAILALEEDKGLTDEQKSQLASHFQQGFEEKTLKPWHLRYLADGDFCKLTLPELIRSVPLDQATRITEKQAAHLTQHERELISQLEYPAIRGVSLNCYAFVKKEQIAFLDPDVEIDKQIIRALPLDMYPYFSDKALQHIPVESVCLLNQELAQRLTNPELLIALNQERLDFITPSQKGLITKQIEEINGDTLVDEKRIALMRQIQAPQLLSRLNDNATQLLSATIHQMNPNEVNNAHLGFLSESQLRQLTDKNKILALPKDKIPLLAASQIEKFEEQELAAQMAFVQQLGYEGLKAMNLHRLHASLTEAQLHVLDGSHSGLIRLLPPERLSFLQEAGLQEISEEQVQTLSSHNLNRLTKESLLLSIPENRIGMLEESALANLKAAINQPRNAKDLKAHHLRFVEEELITKECLSLQLVTQLPPKQFAKISRQQLEQLQLVRDHVLSTEQIQSLPIDKVDCLTRVDQMTLLSTQQIAQMTIAHTRLIQFLSKEQITSVSLFPASLIASLSDDQLHHLNANAENLKQVPNDRQQHLSDEQLQLLYRNTKPNHRLEGLILGCILLPQIIFKMCTGLAILFVRGLIAVFVPSERAKVAEFAHRTFVKAPKELRSAWTMSTDYVRYKREYWQIGGRD